MNGVCRTCLVSSQDMCPLFNENVSQVETEFHDAADLLMMFTSVQIDDNSSFPDKICIVCLDEIQRAYSFKLKCEKSQIILQQLKDVKVNLKQFKEDQYEILNENTGESQSSLQNDCKQDINEKGDSNTTGSNYAMDCERNDDIDMHLMRVLQDNILPCKQNYNRNDKIDTNSSNSTIQDNRKNSDQSYKTAKVEFANDKIDSNLLNTPDQDRSCKGSGIRNANLINSVAVKESKNDVDLHEIAPSTHHIKKEPMDHTPPDYCMNTFKSEPELDIDTSAEDVYEDGHEIKDTEEFECAPCTKVFQSLKMYRDHMVAEHFEDKLCKLCNEEFECSQFEHLTNHLPNNYFHQTDHREFSDAKSKSVQNVKSFCEYCLKQFQDLKILRLHVAVEHITRMPSNCRICSIRFLNYDQLWLHMKNVHNNEKPFMCELCQVQFQQYLKLKYHLRTHHANEISAVNVLKCEVCGRILAHKSRLAEHMRSHTGESPFHCKLCPEKFRYSNGLKSHMRMVHSTGFTGNMQDYQCNICKKIFAWKDHLTRHMRVHTVHTGLKSKQFKCEICLKEFRCKRSYKSHTLTHSSTESKTEMRRSARKSCTTTNE